MGAETSRPPAYAKLSRAIPPVTSPAGSDNYAWVDRGIRPFIDAADREQFIYALITVATQNDVINYLSDDFKLVYSRRRPAVPPLPPSPKSSSSKKPSWLGIGKDKQDIDDGTRLVCTLVAIDPLGKITAKIEPHADGADVSEAFRAFKRYVELKLDVLLKDVPGSCALPMDDAEAAKTAADHASQARAQSEAAAGREIPRDEPPAYGDVKR